MVTDEHGKPVTRASTITATTVRGWLTNPTVAGHRVHRGADLGPGSGAWPPILDEDTFQACRSKLGAPRTVRRADGGSYPVTAKHTGNPAGRKYLLTGGLTVCGVCQAPLVGTVKQLRNATSRRDKPYLICHPTRRRPDGTPAGACVGIMLPETEAYVLDRLWAELDKPEFLGRLTGGDHDTRRKEIGGRLAAVETQRRELAALWATPGELTTAEWKTARAGLDEQETALRGELAAIPPPLVNIDITAARTAWPLMNLDERREFVRLFIERVTIHRAKPGTKGYDAGRVSIDWRYR